MGKDYVAELEALEKSAEHKRRQHLTAAFRRGYHSKRDIYADLDNFGMRKRGTTEMASDVGSFLETAHRYMNNGVRSGNLVSVIQGATMYNGLGLGNRDSVKRRLLAAVKSSIAHNTYSRQKAEAIKKFLQAISSSEKDRTLEHRVLGAAIVVFLAAFLASRASISGYAVNTARDSSAGWMGVVTFLFILLGIVMYKLKKK